MDDHPPVYVQPDAHAHARELRCKLGGDRGGGSAKARFPEGARLQVSAGPQFDGDGRGWYAVTGWEGGGERGWSAGAYLVRLDPGSPDPVAASGASDAAAGRSFSSPGATGWGPYILVCAVASAMADARETSRPEGAR